MCYYLYGTVEGNVNENLFNNLNNMQFKFKLGTYSDLVSCIKKGAKEFRLTSGMCDCATAIGGTYPFNNDAAIEYEVDEEIQEYSKFIRSLTELRNIKNLYICKKYDRDNLEGTIELQIDDIDDLNMFFASIKPNIIYKIGLYKKYY